MPIPDEYAIEKVIFKADNVTAYRAKHPLHGKVIIYVPDDSASAEATAMKRHMYQGGIQMRGLSQLNLPFVAKALEVSQNPNEPYIITKYAKYSLEELINDGVKLKAKRAYQIVSQVLRAIMGLAENGWCVDCLSARLIRLDDVAHGDLSFGAIRNTGSQAEPITRSAGENAPGTVALKGEESLSQEDCATKANEPASPEEFADSVDATRTLEGSAANDMLRWKGAQAAAQAEGGNAFESESLRLNQRNIFVLGGIAYQLLFGEKYHLSDHGAVSNIRKLGSRWRTIFDKSLSPDLDDRYESCESMLRDVERVLSRNKKIAFIGAPIAALLVILVVVLGYGPYRRYRITTSEAGQTVKTFLNTINKNEPPKPDRPPSAGESDDDILRPFEEIDNLAAER